MAGPSTCSTSKLTQQRAMKNIIVPISSKLSQLIELSERLSSGDCLTTLLPDSKNASAFVHDVREAGESLIQVAKDWINKCEDTTKSAQMKEASEHLQEAIDKVYQLSENLNSDSHSETSQELVLASNHLLQYTFQIFLIAKESESKNLCDVVTKVKNKASMLKWNSTSAESMTKYFKELTEELLLLNKLCMRRHKELGEQQQQDMIVNGLQMIRIIFPSLQETLKTCLARPDDKQAKSRRDFIIHRIITAASLLNDVIMNRLPTDPMVVNEPGFFVNLLSKIINALSETNRVTLCEEFESWLHSAIQHAMCVSHFIPQERRELVVNVCLKVLEAQRNVCGLYQKISSDIKEGQLKTNYNSWCNKLIDYLCHLEIRINKEVLHLLVSVFAETSEPLERLVDPILFPGTSGCDAKKLMSLKDSFHNHLDSVWNVARFVAASSRKFKRVREIEIAIHNFECVDPEISSLISLKIQELSNQPSVCVSDAAIVQLKMLVKEWKSQMTNLVTLLDLTIDPSLFLAISAKRLNGELMACHDLAVTSEFPKLLCLSRSIRAKTMRIAQFLANVKTSENTFSDPLYQTQFIEKIQQALHVQRMHHKSLKEAAISKGVSKFNVTSFLESTSILIEISQQATNSLSSPDNSTAQSVINSNLCPFIPPQNRQPLLMSVCSPGCNQLKTLVNCPSNITTQITLSTPTIHWTELTSMLTHPPNNPWNVMPLMECLPSTNSNRLGSSSDTPHNTLV